MPILRKYATATTVYFPLIGIGTVNFTSTASLTTADMKISKDGGAFTTVGTAITNVGSYGYSYTCTTADLTAKCATIVIISTAGTKVCEDTMILIETYGNASAQHPFDLGTASVTVSGGTITSVTNSVTATVGTNNDKTGYSLTQTFPSNFADLAITAGTGLVSISTASVVQVGTNNDKTGYSLSQTFPSNFADLAITAGTGLVSISTASVVQVGTNNDKTGYSLSQAFPTNFADLSITATTGLVAVSTATVVQVGTNNDKTGYSLSQAFPTNFSSLSITTGGLVGISTASLVQVGTIASGAVTSIWAATCTEPTAVVAAGPTAIAGLSWLLTLSRNKITQSSTLQTLFADDGSTTVAASTISDDGSTFTKAEWA